MYLLDSDNLIYILKGKEEIIEIIKNLKNAKIYTSIICVGEVLEGLYCSKNKKFIKVFEDFLKSLTVLDINRQVIEKFALVRGSLRKEGKLIDNFDLLIAATCLVYNLTLLTGNTVHFPRIPKLKIYRV